MSSSQKRKPTIVDKELMLSAGINPKTGLPFRIETGGCDMKENIRKQLRILDEQNAVNRYTWYNIPCNISSQELERLLYYKGQLCFFYSPQLNSFYFMPYALDGTIDFYGRYNTVHPVPIAEGSEKDGDEYKNQLAVLSTIKLKVLYDVPTEDEAIDFLSGEYCVLVHDYTKQFSQTTISRQILQEPLLDIMSDCIPFMRTALINSTGVKGMRVQNENDYANILDANKALNKAALTGEKFVPVVGQVDFQDLTEGNTLKSEEFMLAMQSLDNYRLSLYGLNNGGLFQKKSHMLEAEQEMNMGNVNLVLEDGLKIRQRMCDIINSILDVGISCEIAESVINADTNGDGLMVDDVDQSGDTPGDQPKAVMEV